MKWLRENKMIAATIVILSLAVIASALDGYTSRREIRRLNTALGIQEKALLTAKEKELKEAEKDWLKVVNEKDAKLAPVLRERDALRAKLAARSSTPFDAPATDRDIVARWRALGYPVRVGPCR